MTEAIAAVELPAALDRARRLARAGGRRMLGIAGAPGAGKSSLAAHLARDLGERAVVVPMDGFHLAGAELARLGRADRKGAQDTFDAGGLVALLRRLRAADEPVVYAPEFRRAIEEPIAGAIPVPATVPLVICEGNYLLLGDGAWGGVRPLLDECWYVEADEAVRLDRLVRRHVAFGKEPAYAAAWVRRSDERNARLIETTRARADLVVRIS